MRDFNKLADALENIAHMEYPSGHHDGNNLIEAAALLRAAAGVDVAGLMALAQDFGSARWAEGFDEKNKPHGQPARHKKEAVKQLTALESALRLVLAQRVPPGCVVVPVEPTEAMLEAAHNSDREYTLRNFGDIMTVMQGPYDHWCSMIAAAPQAKEQTA